MNVDIGRLPAEALTSSGWWIRMREFGSEKRLPLAPAASSTAAIDAACPMQYVGTSGLMNCIVS